MCDLGRQARWESGWWSALWCERLSKHCRTENAFDPGTQPGPLATPLGLQPEAPSAALAPGAGAR